MTQKDRVLKDLCNNKLDLAEVIDNEACNLCAFKDKVQDCQHKHCIDGIRLFLESEVK